MAIIKFGFLRAKRLIKQILGLDLWTWPQVKCTKMIIGLDYGGYCICPDFIKPSSIIYSVGVGNDILFDQQMMEKFKTDIFAFDPTPRSIQWIKSQKLSKKFHFYEYGIAGYDGLASFNAPKNPEYVSYSMANISDSSNKPILAKVHRLLTIMKLLYHKKIDVLKIDIEGAEYEVLDQITDAEMDIDQILVEFHPKRISSGLSKTKRIISRLNMKGYKIFFISPSGDQYSFIHISKLIHV